MGFDFALQPGRELVDRGLVKTEEPLVSIITPYYNAGKYFEQTFNCVLNQTFPIFEWIIVNDGSTDQEDVTQLERFAALDPRIRLLHKENGGPASARNIAIINTCTEIIIPVDADDLIEPTYIEELYWGLYYNAQASVGYTNSVGFQEQEYTWNRRFDISTLRKENFLCNSAAFRKAALLDIGIYDEIAELYDEDWRMWLKLFSAGKTPVKIASYGFWYRRSDTGVLSAVRRDPHIRKQSKRLIKEAAKTVDLTVEAIEYPHAEIADSYSIPTLSEWNKPIFDKPDKTHILMLLPWMVMGGADKFNLDVVRGFDKSKYEIGIITTMVSDNDWKQLFGEHVADIFNLPDFLDMKNWAEFISYYIKSRHVDILFLSNTEYGYFLLPWLRKVFPELVIVDYLHMTEWNYRNGGFPRKSGLIGEVLDRSFACNNVTRTDMIDYFGRAPETIETIYIGVDHTVFDPSKIERGLIYSMLEIDQSRPIVLFPCRLDPQKRPFLMIEIAESLKEYIANIVFLVVGDGYQLDELKANVKKKGLVGTVYFTGKQLDMLPFYKDSKVTLICSIKEGLALTTYESLSMCVPVVSADVGGQSELVDSSVGALIPLLQNEADDFDVRSFDTKEVEMYVEALREILTDEQKYTTMAAKCRKRIESGFSIAIMLEKLQSALQDIYENSDLREKRIQTANRIKELGGIAETTNILYSEIQLRDTGYKSHDISMDNRIKNELLRIANSRIGWFLIKLAVKLKLHKLFR